MAAKHHPSLPTYIKESIRQWMELEEDDKSKDAEIDALSFNDALDAYLRWNGIIGYTDTIVELATHYGVQSKIVL